MVIKKQNETNSNQPKRSNTLLLYLHDLAYLIAVMMIVFLLFFRVVVVSGASMNDTLADGDYLLLISSVFYKDPQPGDIIVASKSSFEDGVPIVKRVIATEGQTVNIDFSTNTVYVDGVALDEPYINENKSYYYSGERLEFPLVVDEGCVFVLGDNRPISCDSRSSRVGMIDCREILGKAVFLFLPGVDEQTNERDFSKIGALP